MSAEQRNIQEKLKDIYLPFEKMPPRKFETESLYLVAIEKGDAQLYFDMYCSDPVATKYMSFPTAKKVEDVEPFISNASAFFNGEASSVHQFVWKIQEKASGEFFGSCGYGPRNAFTLSGGYVLGRDFWGKGYATEAWSCLVDYAKEQPRVYRVEATFHPDNPASGRVMEKSGMVSEGLRKRSLIFPNVGVEPQDEYVYAWTRN